MPQKSKGELVDNAGPGWTKARIDYLQRSLGVSDKQLIELEQAVGLPMQGRRPPKKSDKVSEAKALVTALRAAERQLGRLIDAQDNLETIEESFPKDLGPDDDTELSASTQKAIFDYHNSPIHDSPRLMVAMQMEASQSSFDEPDPNATGLEQGVDLKALRALLSTAREKAEMITAEFAKEQQARFVTTPHWVRAIDSALKQGFILDKSNDKNILISSKGGFVIFEEHRHDYLHHVSYDQSTLFAQICELALEVSHGTERGGSERAIRQYVTMIKSGRRGLFPIPT